MKSHSNPNRERSKKEELVERMQLPKDLFLGMPLLSMEGNRSLCIVNHRGIVQYCPECIVIAAKMYHIRITGRNLSILRFSSEIVEIEGIIEEIVFLL